MTYEEFMDNLDVEITQNRVRFTEALQDLANKSMENSYRLACRNWAARYFKHGEKADDPYPKVPMMVDYVYDWNAWPTGQYYTVQPTDTPVCAEIPKPSAPSKPPNVPVFKCPVGDGSGRWLVGIQNSVEPGFQATGPDGKVYEYTVLKGIFGMPLKLWIPVEAPTA